MNKALMAKLAWFLASNKDRPWTKCFLEKYCKFESFWSVSSKSNDSHKWKAILETRDILLRGSMFVAASGDTINFWTQPWIPWLDHHEFTELMQQIRLRRYTISTLADVSIDNEWNEGIIFQIFGEELGNRIIQIPRIPTPFSDQIYWKNSLTGQFSVKSAYFLDQSWRFAPPNKVWNWLWEGGIHPKTSIILWRLLNEAIPTKNRLPFVRDKDCILCDRGGECAIHLFRDCSFAKAVWFGSNLPLKIDCIPGGNMRTFVENLISSLPFQDRKELLNFIGCVFSEIWHQRNATWTRNLVANPTSAIINIMSAVREIKNALACSEGTIMELHQNHMSLKDDNLETSSPIEEVRHVLFTDASWIKGVAGIAAIGVERSTGRWFVKAQRSHSQSALEAELRAILLALNWAVEEGWKEVHILSDSLVAVTALSTQDRPPEWKSSTIYFSIVKLLKNFVVCKFFYINRSLNTVADGVAKGARVAYEQHILYQGEGIPPVIPIYFSA
ncbi:uncharacterized protein LOC133030524 [Cannabis sativa]|uniref:uncharacterized protein LOC133030524 n=1 Tax=Cannabis sativa TaxID=3483 RepID=UPI0029C9C01E|nr:uncharacterized protein LOC133030524 [Cannabis sativa]